MNYLGILFLYNIVLQSRISNVFFCPNCIQFLHLLEKKSFFFCQRNLFSHRAWSDHIGGPDGPNNIRKPFKINCAFWVKFFYKSKERARQKNTQIFLWKKCISSHVLQKCPDFMWLAQLCVSRKVRFFH